MALLPATLAAELIANVDNFTTITDAPTAWADSFDTYFQSAMAGAIPIIPAVPPAPSVTADARDAMEAALLGMHVDNMGSTKIVAGITAYWGSLSTNAATIFVVAPPAAATAITPPAGLLGLKDLLDTDFAANTTGMVAKEAALTTIANTIHTAQSDGVAQFPAPPGGLGPQTII